METSNHRWIILTLVLCKICSINSSANCTFSTETSCSCKNVTVKSRLSDEAAEIGNCIEITLKNISLNILPTNYFTGLEHLRSINLDENHIEDIEAGAFSAPTQIEDLRMNKNQLKHIARGWFNSLTHLKYLQLSFNLIETIEDESFHGLHSLENLDLSNNKLNILPENWFISFNELRILNISNNSLKNIDFKMHNLHNLKIMNFSMNQIREISHCKTIVDNTTITTSCYPKSLECINLDHNIISKLKDDSLEGLRNLNQLYLNNNKLNKMPLKLFMSLEQLNHLSIAANDIQELKVGVFSGLQNLKTLEMSNLQMKELDARLFAPTNRLSHLDISSNKFGMLNDEIFNFCPQLESINIEGNEFSCSVVASIVIHSRRENFTVICSKNFEIENIIGIPCIANVSNEEFLRGDQKIGDEIMYNIFYISSLSCLILLVMLGIQVYYQFNSFQQKKYNNPRPILTI